MVAQTFATHKNVSTLALRIDSAWYPAGVLSPDRGSGLQCKLEDDKLFIQLQKIDCADGSLGFGVSKLHPPDVTWRNKHGVELPLHLPYLSTVANVRHALESLIGDYEERIRRRYGLDGGRLPRADAFDVALLSYPIENGV
jgi:hypothetical protein